LTGCITWRHPRRGNKKKRPKGVFPANSKLSKIGDCRLKAPPSNTAERSPSPFLDEIPKGLIKIHERENGPADNEQAEKYIAQMRALFD